MEPAPAAPLIVPQPEFLLELLVVALDPPAQLGKRDEAVDCCLVDPEIYARRRSLTPPNPPVYT